MKVKVTLEIDLEVPSITEENWNEKTQEIEREIHWRLANGFLPHEFTYVPVLTE